MYLAVTHKVRTTNSQCVAACFKDWPDKWKMWICP